MSTVYNAGDHVAPNIEIIIETEETLTAEEEREPSQGIYPSE